MDTLFTSFRVDLAPMRMRRRALGISRERLAAMVGVDPVTIWRYETGRTEPSLRHIVTIARVLGVPMHDLFTVREKRGGARVVR
jgi:transcriptional regulator with XRE-family HTH domain